MARPLAVVTGGTSGIGFAIARRLAREYDLALAYGKDVEKAGRACDELLSGDNEGIVVKAYGKELRGTEDCASLVQKIRGDFTNRPISVLVNSAGRIRDQIFVQSEMQSHELTIEEHLIVPMALTRLLLPEMYKSRFGRIVNVGSISAHSARPGQTSYSSAKAGLEAFTRGLALEVAHRGVTVNLVAPGMIETPMTLDLFSRIENVAQAVPVGFLGQPDDVAYLVEFLCSDKARFITGAVIPVDGGRSLGRIRD